MIEVFVVNAFTADGAGGNPAGVVLHADGLSAADMQQLAQRVGFSETAFLCSSKVATHGVRFFTPTNEVDLCGHATIATWALLREQGLPSGEYTQETMAGTLKINIEPDDVVFMEQAPAVLYETMPRSALTAVLGIGEQDLHPTLEPQIVSTGQKDGMVPLRDERVLTKLHPNLLTITDLSKKYGIMGLHVFALSARNGSLTAARNFSPFCGIPEEAATGTCTGAMLCYLREHGALPEANMYRAEQGRTMGRLSYLFGKFDKGVWIGGRTRIVGKKRF